MKKSKVLIVGSMAFDNIKTHKSSVKNVLGGSASYSSIAASFFAQPKVIAVVGNDFTKKHIKPFRDRGVDTSSIEVKDGKTFTWAASYDKDFKNATTLSTQLNVFADFAPVIAEQDKDTQALFLANISPQIQLDVLKQINKPRLVACDTMNLWIKNNKPQLLKLLKSMDIVFVNEAEARQLTGIYNLIKAGKAILKTGPKITVIKLGPNGALLLTKDEMFQVPPFLVEDPIDTTGAGDTFGGGFIGYLASVKNWNNIKHIRKALAYGTILASFAIESFSIKKLSQVSQDDFKKRLALYEQYCKF